MEKMFVLNIFVCVCVYIYIYIYTCIYIYVCACVSSKRFLLRICRVRHFIKEASQWPKTYEKMLNIFSPQGKWKLKPQ